MTLFILVPFGMICFIGFVIFLITCNSYDDFNSTPEHLHISGGYYFTQLTMSFKKWKTMFELDPTKFNFVDKSGNPTNFEKLKNFKAAVLHPAVGDGINFYWIDFSYLNYLQYFFYQWEISKKLNYVNEEKLTKSIIASTQAKIDKAMKESQRMIEESLNRQKDIILRLDEDMINKSS